MIASVPSFILLQILDIIQASKKLALLHIKPLLLGNLTDDHLLQMLMVGEMLILLNPMVWEVLTNPSIIIIFSLLHLLDMLIILALLLL